MNNKDETLTLIKETKKLVKFLMGLNITNTNVAYYCGYIEKTLNRIEELIMEEK